MFSGVCNRAAGACAVGYAGGRGLLVGSLYLYTFKCCAYLNIGAGITPLSICPSKNLYVKTVISRGRYLCSRRFPHYRIPLIPTCVGSDMIAHVTCRRKRITCYSSRAIVGISIIPNISRLVRISMDLVITSYFHCLDIPFLHGNLKIVTKVYLDNNSALYLFCTASRSLLPISVPVSQPLISRGRVAGGIIGTAESSFANREAKRGAIPTAILSDKISFRHRRKCNSIFDILSPVSRAFGYFSIIVAAYADRRLLRSV